MGRPRGLAEGQRRTLGRLKSIEELRGFYLAGGTAVAHHLGHRSSLDLDLFSSDADVDLERIFDAVKSIDDAELLSRSDATLRMRIGKTPVDIVRYPYLRLEAPRPGPEGFPVAGVRDLAAMKVAAISRRGIRRDFWDLCALADGPITLALAVKAYQERYRIDRTNLYHVLRSLTYFDDADREARMPAGLTTARWEEIKAFFRRETPKLALDEEL
jgi:hypothetical protein